MGKEARTEDGSDLDNEDDNNGLSGPDGNGESGHDLDLNNNNKKDDGLPSPVDAPPIFSEVVVTHRKGVRPLFLNVDRCADTLNPAQKYPCASFQALGRHIGQVDLDNLVCLFLFYDQNPTFAGVLPPPLLWPTMDNTTKISVYHSATATFCTPSDPSGISGLHHKTIWCTPWWQTGDIVAHRRDCVVMNTGLDEPGMRGSNIARVHLFFLFEVGDQSFLCFCKSFDKPDPNNGMWVVEPDLNHNGYWVMSVVHVDSIICTVHLLPVFCGDVTVPREVNFSHTLDIFTAFYVNKYIDYHAFETLF